MNNSLLSTMCIDFSSTSRSCCIDAALCRSIISWINHDGLVRAVFFLFFFFFLAWLLLGSLLIKQKWGCAAAWPESQQRLTWPRRIYIYLQNWLSAGGHVDPSFILDQLFFFSGYIWMLNSPWCDLLFRRMIRAIQAKTLKIMNPERTFFILTRNVMFFNRK